MRDPHLTVCQRCGSEGTVKRKIGLGSGIIFKGSGFYETDFKDKKGSNPEKTGKVSEEPKKEAPAAKSEATTSEVKTRKKTETAASASTKSDG